MLDVRCCMTRKKSVSKYNQDITIPDNIMGRLDNEMLYGIPVKTLLIELPNKLKETSPNIIINEFKNLVNYKYTCLYLHLINDNLYLTILYQDREIKYDYEILKHNRYYYKKSGKRLKKCKYNKDNDNHLLIKAGTHNLTYDKGLWHKNKKQIVSNSLEYMSKKEYKQILKEQKVHATKIINHLLKKEKRYDVIYMVSNEYIKVGLKTLKPKLKYYCDHNKEEVIRYNLKIEKKNKEIKKRNKERIKVLFDYKNTMSFPMLKKK